MVNLEVFDVRLDHSNSTYAAGEVVSGTIFLSVTPKQRVKIKELVVTLSGEAKTHWINKVSDNIYDTLEPYLNERQPLKNQLADAYDEQGALSTGVHQVNFQISLPPTLPSSYESEFGYVRYTCHAEVQIVSAEMQRSMSFRRGFSSRNKTISVEKPFLVVAQVDVSQLTANGTSRGLRKEDGIETAGCCGVRVGYINAALSVPQSAYVIGHNIPVQVQIENCSRRRLRAPACVSLVQDVHFRSISYFQSACDSKTVSRTMHSVEVENPERGQSVTRQAQLRIPANVPASSVGNTIITVVYKLRLEVADAIEIILPIGIASKL